MVAAAAAIGSVGEEASAVLSCAEARGGLERERAVVVAGEAVARREREGGAVHRSSAPATLLKSSGRGEKSGETLKGFPLSCRKGGAARVRCGAQGRVLPSPCVGF